MTGVFITAFISVFIISSVAIVAFFMYRKTLREAKN